MGRQIALGGQPVAGAEAARWRTRRGTSARSARAWARRRARGTAAARPCVRPPSARGSLGLDRSGVRHYLRPMTDPALDAVLDRVDVLAGRPRTVTELGGGLTNRNLRVTTDDGGTTSCACPPTSRACWPSTVTRAANTRRARPASAPRSSTRCRRTTSSSSAFLQGRTLGRTTSSLRTDPGRRRRSSLARGAGVRPHLRHALDPAALPRDRPSSEASGSPTTTSSSPAGRAARGRDRPGDPSRWCRATTTCSPPTSSTTARRSGSSTTSTPA